MIKDVVVTVEWLSERYAWKDVVVADCRFDLSDPRAGRRAYEESHIAGATYFDLDVDLSRPPSDRGGRHPLPPLDEFVHLLESRGIGDETTVICYDDSGGGMAARLWWMLRYIGHDRVALLDGGWSAWTAAGLPVASGPPPPPGEGAALTVRVQPDMALDRAGVARLSASGKGIIVDSRAPARYRGEVEPLDPVAGHIPGAVNFPWEGNVGADGRWLTGDELAQRFAPLNRLREQGQPLVVHCGSGVTGCVNVMALERIGVKDVQLYVGGWSDWCSDPSNPVATGTSDGESGRS